MVDLDTHMGPSLRLFDLEKLPLIFRPQSLNKLPESLESKGIAIKSNYKHMDNYYRWDTLDISMNKQDCLCLGLSMLSAVLHGERRSTNIKLSHSESDIKDLVIQVEAYPPDRRSYYTKPDYFLYTPLPVSPMPFSDLGEWDKPLFALCTENLCDSSSWDERKKVVLRISDSSAICMIQCLFDLAHTEKDDPSLELSTFPGTHLKHGSAETSFWLPYSIGYSLPV